MSPLLVQVVPQLNVSNCSMITICSYIFENVYERLGHVFLHEAMFQPLNVIHLSNVF